ncbi:General secretion pathway protein A [hydrothermal vent metagenome]|uniref:General secretion pathway protein A n=1 Tax=hydrothermal vent metagenome TaxID=652676 RepID=A0A3B0WHZ1_9ZZZZ
MYNDYFGFKEAPFSIAPDPRYLYMTAQHRDALAHLVYGFNSEGGCILLTGEVGTGKTTICRCLLEQVPDKANVALVLNPKLDEVELLETICDELNISYPDSDNSLKIYTDRIYQFLIESNRRNEKTVLIIDEAQNLNSKVLEQLRLLTNLETNQHKLLQIIILGQPELLNILAKTEMRQLAQRITARFHLNPLTKYELKAYINHRLAVAGQNIQLFPETSIKLLYKLSNGVPRLINVLCDRALLGAYVEGQYAAHPPIIKKAATEVFGELKNVETKLKNKQWLYPIAALSGAAIIIVALFLHIISTPTNKNTSTNSTTPSTSNVIEKIKKPVDAISTPKTISTNEKNSNTLLNIPLTEETTATENSATTPPSGNSVMLTDQLAPQKNRNIPNYDDIEKILRNKEGNQVSAFQALFNAWDHDYYNANYPQACKQAETLALRCMYKQGNLNSLKTYNRPAILTLVNDEGDERYLTITSIQNELATVYSGNKKYTVSLNELDQYWYGDFIIFWQTPKNYLTVISPGDSGDIIAWLHSQFGSSKFSTEQKKYDSALMKKVKAFQIENNLTADGIVGPATIIRLNSRFDTSIPTLASRN